MKFFHTTYRLLRYRGLILTPESEEAYTYLGDYIVEQIFINNMVLRQSKNDLTILVNASGDPLFKCISGYPQDAQDLINAIKEYENQIEQLNSKVEDLEDNKEDLEAELDDIKHTLKGLI